MKQSLAESRIWVIDDEPANVRMLSRLLHRGGYNNVSGATSARAALAEFGSDQPDLILLDLNMPDLSGFDVLEQLRGLQSEESYLPVFAITGLPTAAARERALALGANDFMRKPFDSVEVMLRIRNLLEARSLHVELDRRIRDRTEELEQSKLEVLHRLTMAAECRDDDTGRHTQRVGEMSARIARAMSLPEDLVTMIGQAAPLHDVGKIGIPDAILLKPGKFNDREYDVMKTHATIGALLLSGGGSAVMELAESIARCHHEHWDGSGYPNGLRGEQIPLAARIVMVADVFDAMTQARPYREALSIEGVVSGIRKQAGHHFDPGVVDAFLEVVRSFESKLSEV